MSEVNGAPEDENLIDEKARRIAEIKMKLFEPVSAAKIKDRS